MAILNARAIRIRTSQGWQDIAIQGPQGVQGPTGPQGPAGAAGTQAGGPAGGALAGTYPNPTLAAGTTAPPSGAAGGELRGSYPNPILKPREGAQRVGGTIGAWSGNITNANAPFTFYDASAGNPLFRLGPFTPSVDCWWPVHGLILVRVLDAAWLIMNVDLRLAPADANNFATATFSVLHHSGTTPHVSAAPHALWALKAGVSYYCDLAAGYMNGGTWNWYYGGSQHTYIHSEGCFPR